MARLPPAPPPLCSTGTLLIIDETHTICAGPGGMSRAEGLQPDIFVLGKPIAGGWLGARGLGKQFQAARPPLLSTYCFTGELPALLDPHSTAFPWHCPCLPLTGGIPVAIYGFTADLAARLGGAIQTDLSDTGGSGRHAGGQRAQPGGAQGHA